MEQCKLADELHLSWKDTESMSTVDRKYALKYLELKTKALSEAMDKHSSKSIRSK